MENLKSFLITRLLMVAAAAGAIEALLQFAVQTVLLPLAAYLANTGSDAGLVRRTDLLTILRIILAGNTQGAVLGILARSQVLLILMFSLFLLLVPIVSGLIIYARLVTARVNELQKIRDAEREALYAERNLMLSDFAHDLRTPIMTISGYAGAISDGVVTDPEMKAEYIDALRRKSDRMSTLINLLFEYVKLGSTGFALTKKDCDINELAAETAAALYTDMEDAGMELLAEIPEEPFIAEADKAQAGRILNNLLVNAMRHNSSGTRIAVLVKRLAGMEEIAVADTGVRIEKDSEQLFEPFVKGDDSRSGDKGSGLGLSISKKIADMHGWELLLVQPFGTYTKAFVLRVPEK